jgi:hypothetical protein
VKISTGTPEDHPTPLPLDASATPAVQAPTRSWPSGTEQGGVRDLAGERLSQLADSAAQIAAAQSAGMNADADRRTFYEADIKPLAAGYGMEMTLPPVPEQITAPPNSNLYGQGDQPGA